MASSWELGLNMRDLARPRKLELWVMGHCIEEKAQLMSHLMEQLEGKSSWGSMASFSPPHIPHKVGSYRVRPHCWAVTDILDEMGRSEIKPEFPSEAH